MRTALPAALMLAIGGCASWSPPEPQVVRYICQFHPDEPSDRSGRPRLTDGPLGNLHLNAVISRDLRRVTYQRSWDAYLHRGIVWLRADWRGASDTPPPGTPLIVALSIAPERRSWHRLVIRRNGPEGERVYRSLPFNPPRQRQEEIKWGRFAAMMGEADALHVALVRGDGGIVTEAMLPRTLLAAPAEAAAAYRPDLDRALRDPQHGCYPETDRPGFLA